MSYRGVRLGEEEEAITRHLFHLAFALAGLPKGLLTGCPGLLAASGSKDTLIAILWYRDCLTRKANILTALCK